VCVITRPAMGVWDVNLHTGCGLVVSSSSLVCKFDPQFPGFLKARETDSGSSHRAYLQLSSEAVVQTSLKR